MDLGITGAHHTLALVSYEKGSYSSVDEMEDTWVEKADQKSLTTTTCFATLYLQELFQGIWPPQ